MSTIVHLTSNFLIFVNFELIVLNNFIQFTISPLSGGLSQKHLLSADIFLLCGPQPVLLGLKILPSLVVSPDSLLLLHNLLLLVDVHPLPVVWQHSMLAEHALTSTCVLSIKIVV